MIDSRPEVPETRSIVEVHQDTVGAHDIEETAAEEGIEIVQRPLQELDRRVRSSGAGGEPRK